MYGVFTPFRYIPCVCKFVSKSVQKEETLFAQYKHIITTLKHRAWAGQTWIGRNYPLRWGEKPTDDELTARNHNHVLAVARTLGLYSYSP
jgi:hypothetical protein